MLFRSLSNTNSAFNGVVNGILMNSSYTPANQFKNNFIYGLSVNPGATSAKIYGINLLNGSNMFANNVISISTNVPASVYGIYDQSSVANNSFYFNTIYLSGQTSSLSNNSYAYYGNNGTAVRNIYNNIFYNQYGTSIGFYFNDYNANNDPHQTNSDLRWSNGRQIVARNNWFKTGSKLPSEFLASSLSGSEPGFFAANQNDYHLSVNNPLLTSGTTLTTNIFDDAIYFSNIGGNYVADYAFINPLLAPELYPLVPGESQPVLRDPNLHSVGAF